MSASSKSFAAGTAAAVQIPVTGLLATVIVKKGAFARGTSLISSGGFRSIIALIVLGDALAEGIVKGGASISVSPSGIKAPPRYRQSESFHRLKQSAPCRRHLHRYMYIAPYPSSLPS